MLLSMWVSTLVYRYTLRSYDVWSLEGRCLFRDSIPQPSYPKSEVEPRSYRAVWKRELLFLIWRQRFSWVLVELFIGCHSNREVICSEVMNMTLNCLDVVTGLTLEETRYLVWVPGNWEPVFGDRLVKQVLMPPYISLCDVEAFSLVMNLMEGGYLS